MRYIYTRISMESRTTGNQLSVLQKKYPDATVVEETASGLKRREKLEELISKLNAGDELIVYALDRLGRRTSEVLRMIEDLERRKVVLISHREGVDYSTVVGKLVTQILCSVAEMERNLISERTKVALAARKEKGVRLGRPNKYDADMIKKIKRLRAKGLTLQAISDKTGMSRARIHVLTTKAG